MKIIYAESAELALRLETLTYKELLTMLPAFTGRRTPRPETLSNDDSAYGRLFAVSHGGGEITVYREGFYLYQDSGEKTVCPICLCMEAYRSVTGSPALGLSELMELPFIWALTAMGLERAWSNQDGRENSGVDFHYSPESLGWSTIPPLRVSPERLLTEDADERIVRQALAEARKALPPREKEVVRLYYEGGMTQEAIAQKLGVSQANISKALNRALKNLKKILNPEKLS